MCEYYKSNVSMPEVWFSFALGYVYVLEIELEIYSEWFVCICVWGCVWEIERERKMRVWECRTIQKEAFHFIDSSSLGHGHFYKIFATK